MALSVKRARELGQAHGEQCGRHFYKTLPQSVQLGPTRYARLGDAKCKLAVAQLRQHTHNFAVIESYAGAFTEAFDHAWFNLRMDERMRERRKSA